MNDFEKAKSILNDPETNVKRLAKKVRISYDTLRSYVGSDPKRELDKAKWVTVHNLAKEYDKKASYQAFQVLHAIEQVSAINAQCPEGLNLLTSQSNNWVAFGEFPHNLLKGDVIGHVTDYVLRSKNIDIRTTSERFELEDQFLFNGVICLKGNWDIYQLSNGNIIFQFANTNVGDWRDHVDYLTGELKVKTRKSDNIYKIADNMVYFYKEAWLE